MKPSPKKSDPQNRPQIARIPTLAYDVTCNRDFLNAVAAQYFPSGGLKLELAEGRAQQAIPLQRSTSPPGD